MSKRKVIPDGKSQVKEKKKERRDSINNFCGFPGGSVVKESACNAGVPGQSLGRVHPLEKEMTIHSNILAWETSWTEDPGGLQFMGP